MIGACACLLLVPCPFVIFPCWQACNLSSCSLLLHGLHARSPKGALAPRHNSPPSNLHHWTVCARASKVDHFREELFKYLTWCARGV